MWWVVLLIFLKSVFLKYPSGHPLYYYYIECLATVKDEPKHSRPQFVDDRKEVIAV